MIHANTYSVVETQADIETLQGVLSDFSYVVLDVETVPETPGAPNPVTDTIIDIQIGRDGAVYVAGFETLHEALPVLLQGKRIVGQNLKYDLHCLYRHGVDLRSWDWHDTLLMGRIADENGQHNLQALVKRWLGVTITKKDFWEKYQLYTDAPQEERWEYGAADIQWTARVYDRLIRAHTSAS